MSVNHFYSKSYFLKKVLNYELSQDNKCCLILYFIDHVLMNFKKSPGSEKLVSIHHIVKVWVGIVITRKSVLISWFDSVIKPESATEWKKIPF